MKLRIKFEKALKWEEKEETKSSNSEDEKEKLKRVDKTKKKLPFFGYYFLSSNELQNPLPKWMLCCKDHNTKPCILMKPKIPYGSQSSSNKSITRWAIPYFIDLKQLIALKGKARGFQSSTMIHQLPF